MEKASVQLSTKSWHYRLLKWTFASNAPTPQNMHNLCPYFWLLVFSILIQPIFTPFKLIYLAINWLSKWIEKIIDVASVPSANDWFNNLDDYSAFFLWEEWWYDGSHSTLTKGITKIPYNYKVVQKMSARELLVKWLKDKKKIDLDTPEGKEAYNEWREKIEKELTMTRSSISNEPKPVSKLKAASEETADQLGRFFDRLFTKIHNAFNGWKEIIKWTKRVVGAIITAIGLTATFFFVQFSGRGVIWVVQHWNWQSFWIFMIVLGCFAAVGLMIWGIGKFAEYLRHKDYDVWYAKLFYYLIVLPIKFILVDFIWEIVILKFLVMFLAITVIAGGAKLLWKGFKGFLGIFGEYFGASYGDYCPGIEWKEEK